MFINVPAAGIAATVVTVLMVAVMLYLVWGAVGESAHTPTPDDSEQTELDEGDDDDAQAELGAGGNSV